MRVVVTGGAGFIGANLCRHLAEAGLEPVALDDLSTGFAHNLDGLGAQLVEEDMTSADVLDDVCAGADAIVHLGARPSVPRSVADPMASHHANATGTMEVLEAARRLGVGHVVVASSSSVYGANPTLPKSEDLMTAPLSPYAASKLATEAYALAHAHVYGMSVMAFRFFNVFGPLQPAGHAYAAVIPAFIDAAMRGEPLTVHGDGKQTRDFTYVDSVCAVITASVRERIGSPGPVNLAFGGRLSLLEVIEELERAIGHGVAVQHTDPRPGDVRDSQADQRRLRALFPDIEPVSFGDGLRATVAWFRTLS